MHKDALLVSTAHDIHQLTANVRSEERIKKKKKPERRGKRRREWKKEKAKKDAVLAGKGSKRNLPR